MTIVTVSTDPCAAKTSRSRCSVTVISRFPTKMLVTNSFLPLISRPHDWNPVRNCKRRSWKIASWQGVALSERLYVLSLQTLGALRHFELHRLALLQALEAARLDCRKMHKNIFATLTANEAVAFGVVEPLYCSLFCHVDTVSLSN